MIGSLGYIQIYTYIYTEYEKNMKIYILPPRTTDVPNRSRFVNATEIRHPASPAQLVASWSSTVPILKVGRQGVCF